MKQYSKIKEKVLNYIKKENIEPRSKWYFVIKNETIWILWIISILIGAISVSAIIFSFSNIEWEYYFTTHGNLESFIIDSLPYLWIISLFVFIFVAYKNFKNTNSGYKYSIAIVLFISILVSILGGSIFYALGFGEVFDEETGKLVPFHKPMMIYKKEIWMNPEKGLIMGEIIETDSNFNLFKIKSEKGDEWVIDGSDLSDVDKEILTKFRVVRVIGIPIEKNGGEFATTTIKGCVVLPFEIMGQRPDMINFKYPQKMKMFKKELIKNERNQNSMRINKCEGMQPSKLLKELRNR